MATRDQPLPGGIWPSLRATPFTYYYVVELLSAFLLMQIMDPTSVQRVVAAASTDVAHLTSDPGLVLVASALLPATPDVPPALIPLYLLLFGGALALLERRIGTLRTAAIFAAGHVLATLATELPIALAVEQQWLPGSAAHRMDVGVSFGLCACLGAATGLLGREWRPWALAAVLGCLAVAGALSGDPVAAAGHPLSLLVGVACWPVVWRGAARRPLAMAATGSVAARIAARLVGAGRTVHHAAGGVR